METTKETLKREFQKELHAAVEVGEWMAIGEFFFPWGSCACHQIALYYPVFLTEPASIPLMSSFFGYDDLDGQRMDLEFCWVPLKQLPQITMYPRELKEYLSTGGNGIFHFVSKQL